MKCTLSLLLLASLSLPSSAPAQAIEFAGTGTAYSLGMTAGWQFTAGEDLYVTSVGLWDLGGDGFAASHHIRIWSSDGSTELVASQIPAGTSATLAGPSQGQGRFRYVEIPKTLLRANTPYVIGAQTLGDPFLLSGLTAITSEPEITWDGARMLFSGWGFPTAGTTNLGGMGPNFLFHPADADQTAVEITTAPSPQILNFNATRGWLFRVEEDVLLTSVGMWDHNADGLLTNHALQIWSGDGSNVLLTSQIPSGTAAPLRGPAQGPGRFRYHSVPTTRLYAGQQYVIGMQVAGDDFLNDGVSSITSSAAVTWLEDRFTSSGFSFPTFSVGTNTYFGPNFMFESLRDATVATTGPGCVATYASFYEQLTPTAMDLSGKELVLLDYQGGFEVSSRPGTIQPIGSVGTPVQGPTGDDSAMVMGTLAMEIHTNCQVAFSAGNSTAYIPSLATMLNANPSTALYAWTDLNPSASGSGQIWYEENGFDYQVTYSGVYQFNTIDPVTVQFRGNRASNSHIISFGSVHSAGRDWLIGYSPGGSSQDPGPIDYSMLTATTPHISNEPEARVPLLEAVTLPLLGAPLQVRTSNFEPSALLHLGVLGLTEPALPLAFLGLDPTCTLHASPDVLLGPAVVIGLSSLTWTPIDLTGAAMQGFDFYLQAVTLDLSVLSGTTRLSNGLKLTTF
ncbi:MAG: hypothetical protein ACI90M_004699 [Candidatus Azotimanducaceae bacterium]|jgi:hypothetical protein